MYWWPITEVSGISNWEKPSYLMEFTPEVCERLEGSFSSWYVCTGKYSCTSGVLSNFFYVLISYTRIWVLKSITTQLSRLFWLLYCSSARELRYLHETLLYSIRWLSFWINLFKIKQFKTLNMAFPFQDHMINIKVREFNYMLPKDSVIERSIRL